MLEQSVKLSRLIIFYFINNFLIYAPILPNRSQKPVLFAVFSFLERFFSSSTVVSVAKANVLQTPTIAVFARNWSGADPNFAPFRWRIWLALSEFLCLLANQNVTFVTLFCTQLPFFCTQLPFFCTVLPKNCISLSQSQWRNFFMYIISMVIAWFEVIFGRDITSDISKLLYLISRAFRRAKFEIRVIAEPRAARGGGPWKRGENWSQLCSLEAKGGFQHWL